MDKRGVAGEMVLMIYRLILVSVISLIVVGLGAVYYDYYIDVRGAESAIMARDIVNCLAPNSIIDINSIPADMNQNFFSDCGISNSGRFYASVSISDGSKNIKTIESQDDSSKKIKELYTSLGSAMSGQSKYEPGYFVDSYPVLLSSGTKGSMDVSVYAGSEI